MENSPGPGGSPAGIQQHAERIRASGLLGRSDLIRRLFDYLVECASGGRVPKEIEVAIDGFGRAADFDVTQDAMVRVYVHKLRRKLEDYYAQPGAAVDGSLRIPRGEYRLVLDAAAGPAPPARPPDAGLANAQSSRAARPALRGRERWGLGLMAVLLVACGLLLAERLAAPQADPATRTLRANALWAPLLSDDLPIQIVLGDYYIFGERDDGPDIVRLVRDFDINSRTDLEQRQQQDAQFAHRYADLNLGYLPTSSAQALRAVLPILTGTGKRVTITLASELPPSAFKTSHVVYIGYLSGMGMMQDVVFAGSRFAIGGSYDELIDTESGTPYVSEAGGPLQQTERYRDYAYLSTFGGPDGNRHLILAGTRDTAVMQTAEIVSSVRRADELLARSAASPAFEALYEVYGVDRTNLEARLVLARPLDVDAIWGEGPAAADSVADAATGTRR
jgi:hypothetical protein